jgi:eukaryotic-like serine/threonine-protein kinase
VTGALERSRALEEACDFAGASRAALEGGDARRAVRLAVLSGDEALADEAIAALAARSPDDLQLCAAELLDRSQPLHAGRLFARAGNDLRAAESFARAGAALEAAAAFERARRPADAARELERALRSGGDDTLRLALAELCERHGRHEAAARAVQAMQPGSEERRRGLRVLVRSLRALGLEEAARDAEAQARTEGAPLEHGGSTGSEAEGAQVTGSELLFSRFELRREVAQSPHARVLEVFDRMTNRTVALKLLRGHARGAGRDAALRFEREARALARLAHPTIVGLVDYLPDGPALALEWMPGGDLAALLARESFAPARAAEIASAVLGALGEAHRLGVLHRDVKPSNVLFDAVGAPRLSDFGAAHLTDQSSTATAGAIGTYAYMSPEQRLGAPATVASDLYAVGALLYEMLTGRSARPVVDERFDDPPSAFHPDLDARHDALVASLLAERSEQRPRDAFTARRMLEALPWSARVVEHERAPASRRSVRPQPGDAAARFAPARNPGDGRDTGRHFDRSTSRDVLRLPLDDDTFVRARAFAAVSPRHLALVLRALPEVGELWVECPRGVSLADRSEPLGQEQLDVLLAELRALHDAGAVHGAIDAEHVYLDENGAPFLAWPRRPPPEGHDGTDDLRALRSLAP